MLRRPLVFLTELLAAIPSIVYGLWGVFILVPFVRDVQRLTPEWLRATPLFSGGDYALRRMRDWRFVGEPVMCDYGMTFKWRRDFVVLKADRACFGNPPEVRVGLKMRDTADASHPVTDWLKGRRKFTRWLAAGAAT